jgi:dipeptidyl aminopeptidase/acylaminoacyl peptidase
VAGLLLLLLPLSSTAQSTSPVQATDLLDVETIQEVQLSPSGRDVAYTVRQVAGGPDHATSTVRTQLYVGSASGRDRPRQLTRTDAPARQPSWHPDGTRLAFVRPVDGTPQIFVLSLSGGEPYQLTDVPHGATAPEWGPNGTRLLFASALPEPALRSPTDSLPSSDRPGRTRSDLVRPVPRDTLLVLRHETTLDPVDTLALDPAGPRILSDTGRALRTPGGPSIPSRMRSLTTDSLRALSADTLRAVLSQMRLRADTTAVPIPADTAASPDGDLLQMRRWLDQRAPGDAQVVTRPQPQTPTGLEAAPHYRHYFLVDVPGTVTSANPPRPTPRRITRGHRSYEGASWLPGGSQIVVSAPPPTNRHPDRVQRRSLYVLSLRPYRLSRLLQIDGYALTAPRVSVDGTTVAFHATPLDAPSYAQTDVGLFEMDGRSAPQIITAGFDRDAGTYRWSPDGWYLYLTAPARGGRPLYRFAPFARDDTSDTRGETSLRDRYETSRDTFALDTSMVRTAPYEAVLASNRIVQAFDVTDSNALYAALTPENPSELYANTISFNNERRLSSHNTDWIGRRQLAATERVEAWNGTVPVAGRFTRPVGPGAAEAPLVVMPRGGPPSLDAARAPSQWVERQYLAGRGYGVLEVWPRGSAGYGAAFRRANFQNWGPGPARDVLTLTDSVAAAATVDETQLVLAGRGYGASLTTWLMGHTPRFRAGVAQGGIYDLETFAGESPEGAVLFDQFGGPPWSEAPPASSPSAAASPFLTAGLLPPRDTARSPRAALRDSAPLATAHQIEQPLLLLHGAQDRTVPPSQAQALYRRLKVLERPVEQVRYPGVGHGFSGASPTQRIDRLLRLHEFFARYVPPTSSP